MKLIWSHERRHPDTGQPIPDRDQTPVSYWGYGPVQGTRMVRLNTPYREFRRNAHICVATDDLWEITPDGLIQYTD